MGEEPFCCLPSGLAIRRTFSKDFSRGLYLVTWYEVIISKPVSSPEAL